MQNAIGMKSIVLKISGFAKFELDHKISNDHFHAMVMKLSMVKDTTIDPKENVKSGLSMSQSADKGERVFSKDRLD